MTVVGVVVVLGVLLLAGMHTRALRPGGVLLGALFGFLLAATPAGPAVSGVLDGAGAWLWSTLSAL